MKSSGTVKGLTRMLRWWPLYLLPFLAVVTVAAAFLDREAGGVALIFLCIYLVFILWWIMIRSRHMTASLVKFATDFNHVQKQQLEKLTIPYALLSQKGDFMWMNQAFRRITFEEDRYQKHIGSLFPGLEQKLPGVGESASENVNFEGTDYRAEMQGIQADPPLVSLCLFDVTEHLATLAEMEDQKIVLGVICVDNYEDVMKSTETVRQSLLAALIERKLNKYFDVYGGLVRKLDKDKYLLILVKRDLIRVQEDRFSILEEIKSLNIGNEIAVTLSIGVGVDGERLSTNSDYARQALDLCLGRGGDQAIVRTPEGSKFYGGKSQSHETSTRVKARVKAQALRELLMTKDQVLIMGHKLSDFDCIGSAIGIYRAAKTLEKNVHIVLNDITSSVRPLVQKFQESPDYPDDLFITGEKAIDLVDIHTVVVVVDVNRPSYTECRELLTLAQSIVVLDHHRQGNEVVESPTLSYVEPYASSACEMVAEILQYFSDNLKLRPLEAEAIYAGIVVDTNNFVSKTGVRTFEASAYLRRCGADMTRVRKLFRDKLEDYRAKAETISTVELFEGCFAIGVCPSEGIENPTIVGSQAANDLLDIIGVKASIIFTEYKDQIYISARSIDEINVQLIMERLGGGGHLSIAGAQLKGCSLEDAKALVKETIKQMLEEGAI